MYTFSTTICGKCQPCSIQV